MSDSSVLMIRKLADTSVGERVHRFDPVTGVRSLVNPASNLAEPWPLAGIRIENEGGAPARTSVSMSYVAAAVAEGWMALENERVVHAPGGPPNNQWGVTHTFVEADAIVIKTIDGDVRYRVTGQPGKHDDPTEVSGKRVDWFYTLEKAV